MAFSWIGGLIGPSFALVWLETSSTGHLIGTIIYAALLVATLVRGVLGASEGLNSLGFVSYLMMPLLCLGLGVWFVFSDGSIDAT